MTICEKIEMTRHGDPLFWEDYSDVPHLNGVSAMQFIETSTIVCHPLPMLNSVYVNIFSCKDFDVRSAVDIALDILEPVHFDETVLTRGREFPKSIGRAAKVVHQERRRIASVK